MIWIIKKIDREPDKIINYAKLILLNIVMFTIIIASSEFSIMTIAGDIVMDDWIVITLPCIAVVFAIIEIIDKKIHKSTQVHEYEKGNIKKITLAFITMSIMVLAFFLVVSDILSDYVLNSIYVILIIFFEMFMILDINKIIKKQDECINYINLTISIIQIIMLILSFEMHAELEKTFLLMFVFKLYIVMTIYIFQKFNTSNKSWNIIKKGITIFALVFILSCIVIFIMEYINAQPKIVLN